MDTKLFTLHSYIENGTLNEEELQKLEEAAAVLREGGLVAFPTETVYGLGGNALLKDASKKIYAAKGRPSDNPLIVHISDLSQLEQVAARIPREARRMAEAYWPGPLTMIFPKADCIPAETTGGLDTVAVRFPSHPVAMELIRRAGVPVAAPSANRSGRPSTTTARHCVEDLTGRVDLIVDGGSCPIGLESTILDMSGDRPRLLRPGAITREMIAETLGSLPEEDVALKGPLAPGVRPKAPGMKYRHYAPQAPMVIVTDQSGSGKTADTILQMIHEKEQEQPHIRIAVICTEECRRELLQRGLPAENYILKTFGSRSRKTSIAHNLFELLREMDEEQAGFIITEGCSEEDLGQAVMNRMKKAAAWQVLTI